MAGRAREHRTTTPETWVSTSFSDIFHPPLLQAPAHGSTVDRPFPHSTAWYSDEENLIRLASTREEGVLGSVLHNFSDFS